MDHYTFVKFVCGAGCTRVVRTKNERFNSSSRVLDDSNAVVPFYCINLFLRVRFDYGVVYQ